MRCLPKGQALHELLPGWRVLHRDRAGVKTVSVATASALGTRSSQRRRSRNPKEDGVDNSAAAEDGGPSLLQGCDSGEPRLGHAQTADAEGLMDTASEGGSGSERPDMQGMSRPGVSAVHMTCVGRRSDTQIPEPRSPVAFPPCAPRPDPPAQQQQPSIPARPQQLQWAGERSIIFGADITYTYYSFLTLDNLSNILPQDVTYLEMQGCLRVPIRPHLDEFVKHYFLHVHPILPLLNEGDVWEMYGSQPSVSPASDKLPLLMLQAMMFSACPVGWLSNAARPRSIRN